ncbi:hypothetical protein V1517DRAFT_369033 [Lipomyces orientalis]|uniref:Uncharacterized protein n=1 Tax=Lipomyces orientalis TaxID=1233043 RepID=A0ACC3THK0_9ASCO
MLEEQPIALPQLRATVQMGVPPQPGEPPTYCGCLRVLRDDGGLTDDKRPTYDEVRDAFRYLDEVKERTRAARGDPIQEVLRGIREIQDDMRQVRRDIRRMQETQTRMQEAQTRMQEAQTDMWHRLDTVARAQNLPLIGPRREENRAADGEHVLFRIVPFNDGSMPTEHPNNLPPLYTLAAIEGLNFEQLRAYCAGYEVGAGNTVQMRVELRAAIGRRE